MWPDIFETDELSDQSLKDGHLHTMPADIEPHPFSMYRRKDPPFKGVSGIQTTESVLSSVDFTSEQGIPLKTK